MLKNSILFFFAAYSYSDVRTAGFFKDMEQCFSDVLSQRNHFHFVTLAKETLSMFCQALAYGKQFRAIVRDTYLAKLLVKPNWKNKFGLQFIETSPRPKKEIKTFPSSGQVC